MTNYTDGAMTGVDRPTSVSSSGGQTCKACGRRDKFDFYVPDDLWRAVVPEGLANRVVCLCCFDDFARERGVSYADKIRTLYFAGDQATFVFEAVCAV